MLRYAPDEAVAHLKSTGWSQFNTFYEINKIFAARKATFPPQLSAWLREVVRTGPPEAAGRAAYEVNVWSAARRQGEVWSRRQVCANVFGLLMETSSPGQDEMRAYRSL